MNKGEAKQLAERLDKVADHVLKTRPDLAQRIWKVAEWLEGDSDEASYMKRYDFTGTYQQDSDEKFMSEYDDRPRQPARHSEVRRRVEGPVKDLNTTPKEKNPHVDPAVKDYHWASALKKASDYLDKLAAAVEARDEKKLAFKIDQIADQIDAELKRFE